MDYTQKRELPTSIHTRISDKFRISSTWRTFANAHFESQAWETFVWEGDRIVEQPDTLKSADDVINLHVQLLEKYKSKE